MSNALVVVANRDAKDTEAAELDISIAVELGRKCMNMYNIVSWEMLIGRFPREKVYGITDDNDVNLIISVFKQQMEHGESLNRMELIGQVHCSRMNYIVRRQDIIVSSMQFVDDHDMSFHDYNNKLEREKQAYFFMLKKTDSIDIIWDFYWKNYNACW